MKKLEEYVVSIPDFPEEGIIFRDVTSVLQDAEGLQLAVNTMQELVKTWITMWWRGLSPEVLYLELPLPIIIKSPLC